MCKVCKVIKRKRINCVNGHIYFSRVNRNTQISWTYKIDENLTTNVLILLYFIFFLFPRSPHQTSVRCFIDYLYKQRADVWCVLRESRKAWHIWDGIIRDLLLYYIIIFIFFIRGVLCSTSRFRFCGGHKPKKREVEQLGVVAQGLTHLGCNRVIHVYLFLFYVNRSLN